MWRSFLCLGVLVVALAGVPSYILASPIVVNFDSLSTAISDFGGYFEETGKPVSPQDIAHVRPTAGLFGAGYFEMLACQITEALPQTRDTIKARRNQGLGRSESDGFGRVGLVSVRTTSPRISRPLAASASGQFAGVSDFAMADGPKLRRLHRHYGRRRAIDVVNSTSNAWASW